jgi:hypothetical protein
VIVEGCDGKVIEDQPAVPAPSSTGPVIPIEGIRRAPDLPGQVLYHGRRQIGLIVGEAAQLAPESKLGSQPKLTATGKTGQ